MKPVFGRFAAAVLVLLTSAVLPVLGAQPAAAACRQDPQPGPELPKDAGRDPIVARLGLERVWELSTGTGVTVAVVDSGVDGRHPKLADAMTGGMEFSPATDSRGYTSASGGGTEDCENHGTAVAALIAARPGTDDRVVGVAYGAEIAPVRFTVPFAQASSQMIAEAIKAGADRGKVLNLSFAVPVDNSDIKQAVQYAVNKGVVVVAAAGNEAQQSPGQTWYPAAYDGVLAVAAVNLAGLPMQQSNRGAWVDVAAPGENLTTISAGGRGYVTVSGTSFATGVVSGVAALIRAKFPEMSAADVAKRITSTAVPVAGARNDAVGAGVVDPFAALTAAVPTATPAAPKPGAIAIAPLPNTDTGPKGPLRSALSWAGIVAACALVALLAGISVRKGVRRGWRAGHDPATAVRGPAAPLQAPDIDLT